MKKFGTFLPALFLLMHLSAAVPQGKETAKPIELTKTSFLKKVFNYEENPQVARGALPKKAFREAIDTFLLKKEEKKAL
ncbi:MAG: hypothetical protein PHS71_02790 [Proteiniphilum sp.]|nr:hypothetical protein [Proteiniphilum sp.]MDD4801069.1 hypothetical protein [Proteiniphilum sp.]